ncbi:hypothetical protein MUU54_24085, partial [Rhizobium tarimense]|nr:hypothetical protein [Pseudorhizobium tarimense]
INSSTVGSPGRFIRFLNLNRTAPSTKDVEREPVRGDETAEMKIELLGPDRLRLRSFDRDPATNSMVAVTDLHLQRQQ